MTPEEIEQAARALDISARLEGPNRLLFVDVNAPADAPAVLRPMMAAAIALHRRIQSDDALADLEETLEDSIRSDDQQTIQEGAEVYRALLASRLKAILEGPEGLERLQALAQHG
jgi:hypothetical protein